MSDYIPFEIQSEIIKRVPDVKSLIRFRAVSKPCKSFIDSSEFIAGYRACKTQLHTLLLRYKEYFTSEVKYLSVNNDTFTQKQDLTPTVSALMKQFYDTVVIGYSRGLLCLYYFYKRGMLVLWNPSIRRSVGILGFAVCPVTNEPTIVKISDHPWKVEIFTLSSKKWTEIQCRKPRESIELRCSQVVIGSCIYRLAYQQVSLPNGFFRTQYMIVSFDLIAQEFRAIDLPDKIIFPVPVPERFIISKLKGSLVVIVPHREVKVWKMELDCSFTQLFTINTPGSYISNIVGFRKNGELVVETKERDRRWDFSALEVYDPCSHHINNLGFLDIRVHSSLALTRKHCICLITRILAYILKLNDHGDDGFTNRYAVASGRSLLCGYGVENWPSYVFHNCFNLDNQCYAWYHL